MNKEYWIRKAFEELKIELRPNPNRKIFKEDLIKALSVENPNLIKQLNTAKGTIVNLGKTLCPDRPKGVGIDTFLLFKINKKWCYKCKIFRDLIEFNENKYRWDKLQNECKHCQKSYQTNNLNKWRYDSSRRRAQFNERIPNFGQDGIRDLYDYCPKGYEVDHIIPLNGETVCGLHVVWNLQYLLKEDNRKKSNKLFATVF